jgi:F420-dependent oxidoreductase-like protein
VPRPRLLTDRPLAPARISLTPASYRLVGTGSRAALVYGLPVRLGLSLSYWTNENGAENLALAKEADRLGYDVLWVAEAYGSDAVSILSWVAAQTDRIEIGSGIFQIPARTPAMTAMTAATLDRLSQGRFRLGLGVSGPQVSEGWHGVRFAKPLERTREYVDIVNLALTRQRVRYDGKTYTLPLPDGPGKALQLMIHPIREHIPIYLAAVGPKNLELTGELADGWLPFFFNAEFAPEQLAQIAAGRAKVGKTLDGFDISTTTPLSIADDVETAAGPTRSNAALYIGGMGSREQNFYNALAVRMGFAEAAAEVQDKFLARDYAGAEAAVPLEFLDRTSLLGPPSRIAERMVDFADAGVTTLSIALTAGSLEAKLRDLETAMAALEKSGAAS